MSEESYIEKIITEKAASGVITCSEIRKIAEDNDISYRHAGSIADRLKIKIRNCELGCF